MKHFFTLCVALICSTIMLAQTPAQEMTKSTFKGTVSTSAAGKTLSDKNQQVDFTLGSSNDKVDMTLSDCTFAGSVLTKKFEISLKKTTIKGFKATKSGSTYSLSDDMFDLTIYNIEGKGADVKGQITASNIDINGKKASLTLTLTNLPSAMAIIGKSLDIKYDLTLDSYTPASIEDVTVNAQKSDYKFVKDGKVVILNKGVEYNVNGVKMQ